MQQWEQGSAVRKPSYEEQHNPYLPVDVPPQQSAGMSYQPGQLYGASRQQSYAQPYEAYAQEHQPLQPLVPGAAYSAPPTAAPQMEMPSYLQNQPQAMPCAPQQEWAEEEEPQAYEQQEPQWRDPFAPAEEAPRAASHKKRPEPPAKPPVRISRIIALIAALIMLLFCAIVGGRLVWDLMQSERSLQAARDEYRAETGNELQFGAARVDLLPAGQTFVPTSTPVPTLFMPTPTPTPIIPINDPAMLGMSGFDPSSVQATEAPTPTPVLRTRLSTYPDNPLRNVIDSIAVLHGENKDVVGRLVIDGVLDEIVMQRNNTYYLTRNSLGVTCEGGAVFADESCSFRVPPENLLLRGQGSVPGKAFEPLWKFVSGGSAFVSTVPIARLTTLYEEESYVLFAVISAESDPNAAGYFNYASHPTFATDEDMMAYVQSLRSHSLYRFNVDVQPSDRLLTLATLASGDQSSLVLVYRMLRDSEGY